MNDCLYSAKTADFEFTIYGNVKQIQYRQKLYERFVMQNRASEKYGKNAIYFENKVLENTISNIALTSNFPFFFENTQYVFELIFEQDVQSVEVLHKLNTINKKFHYNARNKTLTGIIETGNHIGKFVLPFVFSCNGRVEKRSISFDVLPTKIDIHQDLPVMYRAIDEIYPLWRFNFTAQTEQNTGKVRKEAIFLRFGLLILRNYNRISLKD